MYALITLGQLASGAAMLYRLAAPARDGQVLHDLFHAGAWLGVLGFVAAGPLSRAGDREGPAQRAGPPARSSVGRTTLLAIAFAMAFNLVVGGLWAFAAEYAMVGGKVVMALDAFAATLSDKQRSLNDRVRVLSPRGSTGHAMPTNAKGAPHGDGHRH